MDDVTSIHDIEPRLPIALANANELFRKKYAEEVEVRYNAKMRKSLREGITFAEVDVSFLSKQERDSKRRNSKQGNWWDTKIDADAIVLQEAVWGKNLSETTIPPISSFPRTAKEGVYCVSPKPHLREQFLKETEQDLGDSAKWILQNIQEIVVWENILQLNPSIIPLPGGQSKAKAKTKNQKDFAIEPICDPTVLESIYESLSETLGESLNDTFAFYELLLPEVVFNSVVTGNQTFALQWERNDIWKCTVNLLKLQ